MSSRLVDPREASLRRRIEEPSRSSITYIYLRQGLDEGRKVLQCHKSPSQAATCNGLNCNLTATLNSWNAENRTSKGSFLGLYLGRPISDIRASVRPTRSSPLQIMAGNVNHVDL
ncbi:hypothetical protein EVAR_78589_1 [Eumeta japonica]|uniref:Uncharacterized protein n=1 Tax=Eumeta variegata TaxID=151549 RepID=A0A4C1U7M6_EUMVA|nr:hypothetical protein EVAR_78589_1 [Eumeta japonica]